MALKKALAGAKALFQLRVLFSARLKPCPCYKAPERANEGEHRQSDGGIVPSTFEGFLEQVGS